MRAYDESYLLDAMSVLGEAFDCAEDRAGLGLQQFFDLFVSTGVADGFGAGEPRLVAGTSGAELVLEVCWRAGLDVGIAAVDAVIEGDSPAYWCGWSLAYFQWRTARPFRNIARIVSMEEVCSLYPALHEASEDKFVDVVEARAKQLPSPLQTIRRDRGVSQAQLANMTGVSLRAIQQYEQRCKDVNKAQAASLCRLAQALGCRMEDLLEFPLGE